VKVDVSDIKRTTITIKSIERNMRNMRQENILKAMKSKIHMDNGKPNIKDPYAKELEKERYGSTKRRECGLCQLSFLTLNLPAKIPFRCVMELYAKLVVTMVAQEI